jgi:predicted TIM-barrel fold metal-dependent hydrolase
MDETGAGVGAVRTETNRFPGSGIVDAHHHIWRQRDLPWLMGPLEPRIFGPYEPIRRDYGIGEYLDDIAGCGVVQSVYVQANWAPERFEDEVATVKAAHAETGFPHAIVAYSNLMAADATPQLSRLATHPLVRGIRMQLHWHENPQYRFAARPDLCDDPTLRANIARLAGYGFSFDLQVFAVQMAGAARLAAACPEVTFILQHAGMLEDLSDAGRQAWRDGMRRLAERPNVVTKLSAFGTFVHRNDPDLIAAIVAETLDIFGAERAMFGSNFPIEKLWTNFPDLLAAHQAATAHLTEEDRQAIFAGTARRIYRLPQPDTDETPETHRRAAGAGQAPEAGRKGADA